MPSPFVRVLGSLKESLYVIPHFSLVLPLDNFDNGLHAYEVLGVQFRSALDPGDVAVLLDLPVHGQDDIIKDLASFVLAFLDGPSNLDHCFAVLRLRELAVIRVYDHSIDVVERFSSHPFYYLEVVQQFFLYVAMGESSLVLC